MKKNDFEKAEGQIELPAWWEKAKEFYPKDTSVIFQLIGKDRSGDSTQKLYATMPDGLESIEEKGSLVLESRSKDIHVKSISDLKLLDPVTASLGFQLKDASSSGIAITPVVLWGKKLLQEGRGEEVETVLQDILPDVVREVYEKHQSARSGKVIDESEDTTGLRSFFGGGIPGPLEAALRDVLGRGIYDVKSRFRLPSKVDYERLKEQFPELYQLLSLTRDDQGYYDLRKYF